MTPQAKLSLMLISTAIAMAAGHVVQERAGYNTPEQVLASTMMRGLPDVVVSAVQDIAYRPLAGVAMADEAILPRSVAVEELARNCAMQLGLLPLPNAMIGISLLAPCHPSARAVIRHDAMAFTGQTSPSGGLITLMPALSVAADVRISFSDGQDVTGRVTIPDLGQVRRFVLQWQDGAQIGLHAFENDAEYNSDGHIWSQAPRQVGMQGFLKSLGDPTSRLPLQGELYSFGPEPTRLDLEAEVTADTCGKVLFGEMILSQGGQVQVSDLALAMPDCSAIGEILILNNIDQHMTVLADQ